MSLIKSIKSLFSKKTETAQYVPRQRKAFQGQTTPGSFGPALFSGYDYWTLREASESLFSSNHYAYGILDRVASELIGTGLELEYDPLSEIVGDREDLAVQIEARFRMWGSKASSCDISKNLTWSELQKVLVIEALAAGDVLVVFRTTGKVMKVQLIPGNRVQTPVNSSGSSILHGVEFSEDGEEIAFHVATGNRGSKRITKRKKEQVRAVLFSLKPRRLDQVRGLPILHLVEQSIQVIGDNRDAAQRKSLLTSLLSIFIEKSEDKPGSRPISGAAVRATRNGENIQEDDLAEREFLTNKLMPGTVIETLQKGEKPHVFSDKELNTNFPDFERTILESIAWYIQIPPTILIMKLSSNYSASQGEINMLNDSVERWRSHLVKSLMQPAFSYWLYIEALAGRVEMPGFIQAIRGKQSDYAVLNAWTNCSFHGSTMLTTDLYKTVRAFKEAVNEGWMTNDQASKKLSGKKFDSNMKQIKIEKSIKDPILGLEEN